MGANVAQRGCAEQRVANRMTQHIAIGVPDSTLLKRHFDSANHQFAIFREPMQVIANSGARNARFSSARATSRRRLYFCALFAQTSLLHLLSQFGVNGERR